MITTILSSHLRSAISLHDTLYGFSQGRGMVTEMLEAKLEHQME